MGFIACFAEHRIIATFRVSRTRYQTMKRGGTDDHDLVDLVGSNRSIQPLDALMVMREALYLSGNDVGPYRLADGAWAT